MNKEEMKIAIAEACGWTNIDTYLGRAPIPFTRSFLGGTDDGLAEGEDTLGHEIKPLPDYPNDLNAMHAALKSQTQTFRAKFDFQLHALAERKRLLITELEAKDWADCFISCLQSQRESGN